MILNLTQHTATVEQKAAGVVDLAGDELVALKAALTFDELPSKEEIQEAAEFIAILAGQNGLGGDQDEDPVFLQAMIGGAPFLMSALEKALRDNGIEPLYAFSVRQSVEKTLPDCSVVKENVFRHQGFVRV